MQIQMTNPIGHLVPLNSQVPLQNVHRFTTSSEIAGKHHDYIKTPEVNVKLQ